MRAATVTHRDHGRLEQAVREARTTLIEVEDAFSAANEAATALTRLEALLPTLENLDANAELQAALRTEGPTPDAVWSEAVRAVRGELRAAEAAREEAAERVKQLTLSVDNVVVDREPLAHADTIRTASARLDSYMSAADAHPAAQAALADAASARSSALDAVGIPTEPADAAVLPGLDQLAEMRDAYIVVRRCVDQANRETDAVAAAERRLALAARELPADGVTPVVSQTLIDALTEAHAAHRAVAAGVTAATALRRADERLLAEARSLRLDVADLLGVLAQPTPAPNERQRWEARRSSCTHAVEAAEKRLKTSKSEHDELARRVAVAADAREGLTKETLDHLREGRDAAMREVLATPGTPQDRMWKAVFDADAAADARFESAEAVARLEADRAALVRLETQLDQCAEELREAQAALATCEEGWLVEAARLGLPSVSLAEVQTWSSGVEALKSDVRDHQVRREAVVQKTDRRSASLGVLRAALMNGGAESLPEEETPEATLDRANAALAAQRAAVEAHQQAVAEHRTAARTLADTRNAAEAARAACAAPQERWERACAAFHPAGSIPLVGATDWLDRLDAARRADAAWADAQRELDRLSTYIEGFESRVAPLASLVGSPLPHRERVEVLAGRLEEASAQATRLEDLEQALRAAQVRLERAAGRVDEHTAAIGVLVRQAGLPDADALDAALARSARLVTLETEARGTRGDRTAADVASLRAEVAGRSAEQLSAAKSAAAQRQQELDQARTDARERLRAATSEFDAVDGADVAARAAEDCAAHRDTIEEALETLLVERACALLTDRLTAELSRMGDEGPVQRAGDAFAALTLGAFQGLKVERRNERGVPLRYVSGLRANGERVPPAGMSDGTRDALWLALRVAALESLLDQGHVAPIVLDDVAVHLDDARTKAMLRVFGPLAERTQVLLFTHHRAVVQAAESAGVPHAVVELAPRPMDLPPLSLDAPDPGAAPALVPERSLAPSRGSTGRTRAPAIDLAPVLLFLRGQSDGAGKTQLINAGVVEDGDWPAVRQALLDHADVTTSGQRRGMRYHLRESG